MKCLQTGPTRLEARVYIRDPPDDKLPIRDFVI
jgi:hypothetical protein